MSQKNEKIKFIKGAQVRVRGYIEYFTYRKQETGFSIFNFVSEELEEEETKCLGTLLGADEGDYLELEGVWADHNLYGHQIKITAYRVLAPEGLISIERYLASGAIKGIGASLANRIVKKFKEDTFRVMEEEPERLAEIKGISLRMAQEIGLQMIEKKELREAVMYLSGLGISDSAALKVIAKYKERLFEVVSNDPYRLAEDIPRIGFATADSIAAKLGLSKKNPSRIRAGIIHTLKQNLTNGHTCMEYEDLVKAAAEILKESDEEDGEYYGADVAHEIGQLVIERKIVREPESKRCFLHGYYNSELVIAMKLKDLMEAYASYKLSPGKKEEIESCLEKLKEEKEISLDEVQKGAVFASAENGVFILTGGPGTGKTSTISSIIRYFDSVGKTVLLCAPTGRAAKRMEEATGYEAKTIHRLLEVTGTSEENEEVAYFTRNEMNPLEADVVIVDEMSMVDTMLFKSLLQAIPQGCRLILSGDFNQLPSVGPGNVLKDLLAFKDIKHITLEKIYRQAEGGDIVMNADRIRRGLIPERNGEGGDFYFVEQNDAEVLYNNLNLLIRERIPNKFHIDSAQIQVLSPLRKGATGVGVLNEVLQKSMNPASAKKPELQRGDNIFRLGDKVMQTKNNYNAEWCIRGINGIKGEEGIGIYNGDTGLVTDVDLINHTLTVTFDDHREVEYEKDMLDELEPAYAVTVHKSQGSEYPAVIIVVMANSPNLLTRNLLYTAVSRGTKCVMILGKWELVKEMVEKDGEAKRKTGLLPRLQEVFQLE